MIKRFLSIAALILALGVGGEAHAQFTSPQVGSSPTDGYVLQTNGFQSTWVATSTLGLGGGGATWGSITGTLSNQTDLQSALDGKIDNSSTTLGNVTSIPNLTITESQISDLTHYVDADVSTYLVGGTGITELSGTISFDCSEVEGVGINCSGEAITLDATGDWTGTFDGQEGTYYTDFSNQVVTADEVAESAINFSTVCGSGSKLYISAGNLACGADATGGGGGSGLWATNTPSTLIYPVDITDVVTVGASATSTNWTEEILDVTGSALITDTIYGGGHSKFEAAGISNPVAHLSGNVSGRSGLLMTNVAGGSAPEFRFTIFDPDQTGEYISFGLTNDSASSGGLLWTLTKEEIAYMFAQTRDLAIGSVTEGRHLYLSAGGSTESPDMIIHGTTDNVGIGTLSPNTKLEIVGTASSTNLTVTDTATTTNFVLGTDGVFTSLTGTGLSNTGGVLTAEVQTSDLHDAVTMAGTPDYITLSGQIITRNTIDIGDDTNLTVGATGIELSGDDIALTAGYNIPLTASTTNWNNFYDTPSTRITAGTGLSWSSNTLNAEVQSSDLNNYLSLTDWYATTTDGLDQGSTNLYNQTHTGEVTGATALTIANDIIEEANLEMTNAPTDNFILSYDSGTGGFTWVEDQTGGGGSDVNWSYTNGNDFISPATSTNGIIVRASSTIGDGTRTGGLTVNGGATTTDRLVIPRLTQTDPSIKFDGQDTGIYSEDGLVDFGIRVAGTDAWQFSSTINSSMLDLGVPSGDAGSPSLTFWQDTDTGLFRQGANVMGVSVAGSEMFRFDSGGASTTNLTVVGTTTAGAFLLGADEITDFTGTGITNVSGALTLDATGDWTGTFDGQEGTYYLDFTNQVVTADEIAESAINFSTVCGASSKLYISGGNLACGADATGGGGSGFWASTTPSDAIYPTDITDKVLVGTTSTSTGIFSVVGTTTMQAATDDTVLRMFENVGGEFSDFDMDVNGDLSIVANTGSVNIESVNIAGGTITSDGASTLDEVTGVIAGVGDTVFTIWDDSVDQIARFTRGDGNAVNELTFTAGNTGVAPQIAATGNDTNINLDLIAKGTGDVIVTGSVIPVSNGGGDLGAGGVAWTGLYLDTGGSIDLGNGTITLIESSGDLDVLDVSGNEIFTFDRVASAVNELSVINAATGNNPQFVPTGNDTNIGIDLNTKGTGIVNIDATASSSNLVVSDTATTTNLVINNELFSDLTGTGLSNVAGVLTNDITDEVGTLTTGDLCTNNGSAVNCTTNTEAELETALDSLDVVTVTAGDITEANLYTLLSDVTQFYESGDEDTIVGAISNGAIANSTIIEPDLNADVAAVDGDYLQYDSTGTNFTWRNASEVKTDLSLNNVENTALSTWTGSTAITTLGTVTTGTWNSAIQDGLIVEPDLAADNVPAGDSDILSYDPTGTDFDWITPHAGTDITADLEEEVTAGSLADGVIQEPDLDIQGTLTDEWCLTYETGGGSLLEWQACGAGGGGDEVLIDGTAVTDGAGVDLIGGTNGIDIAFSAAASPDTATFNFDVTEAEADIETAIDTLANLTSVQGFTVTLSDPNTDAFLGWDDVGGVAYEVLTAGEALAIVGGAANDFDANGDVTILEADISDFAIGTADITDGVIIEPDLDADVAAVDGDYLQYDSTGTNFTWRNASEVKTDLALSNVENTALSTWGGSSNIATVGTITTGTWSALFAADSITHADILDSDQASTQCIWFEDPTAADDFKSIWANKTANNFQVTEIWGESDQTVTFMLQDDDGTPADLDTVDLSPAAGEAEDVALNGADTIIAAGDELDLDLVSVSGTPTWVSICWTGNWVD